MKNLLEVFFLFIKAHYFPFLSCAWGGNMPGLMGKMHMTDL